MWVAKTSFAIAEIVREGGEVYDAASLPFDTIPALTKAGFSDVNYVPGLTTRGVSYPLQKKTHVMLVLIELRLYRRISIALMDESFSRTKLRKIQIGLERGTLAARWTQLLFLLFPAILLSIHCLLPPAYT